MADGTLPDVEATSIARPVPATAAVPLSHAGVVAPDEPVPATLRRFTVELFDEALSHMARRAEDFEDGIHRTRTSLKRIRAVLRFGRGEIGASVLRRENTAMRNLGASLADLRDGAVRLQTLGRIRTDFSTVLAADAFSRLNESMSERYRLEERMFQLDVSRLNGVVHSLQSARARYLAWGTSIDNAGGGFGQLAPGIGTTYRAGKRAMTVAFRRPTPEAFHEWRKQVKYFRYQMEMLEPIWPALLAPTAEAAHQLSDLLGMDHDLWVLAQGVEGEFLAATSLAERTVLGALIERSRFELERLARPLGEMLFAESSGALVKRLGVYWDTWRR